MNKREYLRWSLVNFFVFILLFFFSPQNLLADIFGRITDSTTAGVLPGANIIIVGTSLGAASDVNGEYRISKSEPGDYTLRVSYIGYKSKDVPISLEMGKDLEMDIELNLTFMTGEVITVTAQREGQAAAINQQLNADAIKNVVSSDRIREVPDANAAESVGRLPGVAIGRSGGEGNKVVVRGLSPQYSRIAINGVNIPPAGSSDDRSTDISMISNENLSGIEVFKALTADMEADAIGGVVNLQLAKAKEKPVRYLRLYGIYNAQENDFGQYKAVASWSQRFLDNSLGFQASINSELRNRTSEYLDANYELGSENEDGTNNLLLTDDTVGEREEYRTRFGANLILDYDIEGWSFMLSNFYNRSNRESKIRSNSFEKLNSVQSSAISNPERNIDLLSNMLEGRGSIGPFAIDATLSYSSTNSELLHNSIMRFEQPNAIVPPETDYELIDPAQFLKNTIPDSAGYLNDVEYSEEDAQVRSLMAAINLNLPYMITNNITGDLKFGGKYRRNDRDKYSNVGIWDIYLDGLNVPVSSYFDNDYDPGTILDGQSSIGLVLDPTLTNDFWDENKNSYTFSDFGQDSYETQDQIVAGYLMTKLKFGQLITFIPGIRYEQFTGDYVGYHKYSIGQFAGNRVKKEEQIVYNDWLPMIHLKIKPIEWFDLRLAATKTLARASYNQLVPSLYVNTVTDGLITLGNPNLQETISWNYDAYASVYHPKIGLFTVGYFYKAIDGVIVNATNFITSDEMADSLGLPQSLDPDWTSYAERRVRRPINIGESTVKGIEIEYQTNFSYLPWPFKGLVINANYTRIFSETQYSLFQTETEIDVTQRPPKVVTTYVTSLRSGRVPGQADHLANVSLGYDIFGFSARLSFSYQGESLASIGTQEEHDLWRGDFTRWSFSLRQRLGEGLGIYMNGVNLSNQNDLTYRALDYPRPSSLNYYGATYDLGIEYRF
jgi:TonB-dependent receptor